MTSDYRNPRGMTDLERQMATPISDDDARYFEAFMLGTGPFLGAHFGDDPPIGERGAFWWRKHFQAYAARIEALTAERDAAVATAGLTDRAFKRFINEQPDLMAALQAGIAEGQASATAAIVAWFRTGDADLIADTPQRAMDLLADAIERNEHLSANPLDT